MSDVLHQMPLAGLAKRLAAREVSAVELARHFLDRIERHRGLNAFLDIRPEATLAQAAAQYGDLAERVAKLEAMNGDGK